MLTGMNEIRAELAGRIRQEMARLKWSQAELSRRSGVSTAQISDILACKRGCTIDKLAEIAAAFRLPAWSLLIDQEAADLIRSYFRSTQRGREVIQDVASAQALLAAS